MQTFIELDTHVYTQSNHTIAGAQDGFSNLCWSSPWNHQQARFESCFLPVVNLIPPILALIIVVLQSFYLLTRWQPRWTRPFVVEYSADKDDLIQPLTRALPSLHLLVLTILSGIVCIFQIAKLILHWPAIEPLLSAATWMLVLTILLVNRPRTLPFGPFTITLGFALTYAIGVLQSEGNETIRIIDICIFIFTIAAITIMLLMPLRNPALPRKDISAPFTEPTSILRSPEDNLTLWQFMTVSWMAPLINVGSQRTLEDEDVWQLGFQFQHKRLHETFRLLRGTVISRLLQANGLDLVILAFLGLLQTVLEYSNPVLQQRLLSSMQDPAAPITSPITYAAITLLVRLSSTQSGVFMLWYGRRCYERSRGEMITMLYEKTLDRKINFKTAAQDEATNGKHNLGNGTTAKPNLLSRASTYIGSVFKKQEEFKEPASMGKILNLMRNDVYEVAQRFWEADKLITIPLNVIFSAVLVVQFLGPSALIAITTVVVAQIINIGLARVLIALEARRRKATDKKLQIVSQFVEAIRHLRWYGWQDAWLEHIMTARQRELTWRIITKLCDILINAVNTLSLEVAPAIGFYAYTVIAGGSLTVDVGFPALQLMFMLTSSLRDVPGLITTILNAWVAVVRIEDFMAEPNKDQTSAAESGNELAIRNASFAWPGYSQTVLTNINLAFPPGLTVICGEVAAGKTALLQALLGELDLLNGTVVRPDTAVGYCAQTPWLQSMSIRENILFSAPYDERRYFDVVNACALASDLAEFRAGDLSFIGENGIGLSGGQKARVALARAAYSDTKILLLDDPLSALDQQTAESIVRNLFSGPIFRERTVILVTHRLDLVVPIAQQIYEIKDGQAAKYEYDDLLGGELDRTTSKASVEEHQQQYKNIEAVTPAKFIEDEYRAKGGIKAAVYWEYIKAGKLYLWAMLVGLLSVYRLTTVFLNWFIKDWGEAYNHQEQLRTLMSNDVITTSSPITDGLPSPDEDVMPWLKIILLLGLARTVCYVAVQATMVAVTYVAGKRMFKDIMYKVGHATFRFYDVTPVGRLMNRMTSDISVIDGNISQQFHAISWQLLAWSSSLLIVALVTPTFLAFTALLTVLFVVIFRWFLPTSQSLRRLEMVSLTPLMSNFGELLNGLVTVRAFCAQDRFQDRVIRVVDNFQKMDHFYWSLQAWLMYRYEGLASISVFLITMLALLTGISPGLTAFVLLAAIKFVKTTHSLCTQYGQLQMEFVSVERVVELMHLTQEAEGEIRPPAWWPSFNGDIEFKNVQIKYAPHLDPALDNISFTIKAGSKTAILGRTGSGKSTMALALLATILPDQGQIIVDNVDLAQVDKQILRTRVTFLAQDPVLFPGSMRQNLDPLEQHTEDECSAVLTRVCARQGWSLDMRIDGGGRNLSQGQRQLVGLARAVLRRSAIIILDEATASIDLETSMQIQQVLHEEMRDSTVITIAHRLEAVSNADYCIVLGKGRVIRQGPAAELLDRSESRADDEETDE